MAVPILDILAIVTLVTIIYRYLRLLRSISGFLKIGPIVPLFGNVLPFINIPPEELLSTHRKLVRLDPELRKGAVVAGTTPIIVVFHPETVEPVLRSQVHTAKANPYDLLKPLLGSGMLTSKGERWWQRRKLLTPAYQYNILQDSFEIFNKNSDTLAQLVLHDGDNGQKVLDAFSYLRRCALDIIVESATGTHLNIQHDKISSEYVNSVNQASQIVNYRLYRPWLWNEWVFSLTRTKRLQDKCLNTIHGFTRKILEDKRMKLVKQDPVSSSEPRKVLAFLDHLMSIKTSEGKGLSDEEMYSEINTFLVAGYETTGCVLSWALLLLANHPEIQDRIVEEQKEIFGDNPGSDQTDVLPEHIFQMKYLECCIKETLRLYPGAPLFARQLEEGEDLVIDGIPLPKGCLVKVFISILHRNPMVWEEPDEFRPERFLPGNRTETERHPYAYIPFSAGIRNCIGQKFAMVEMKVVLSKLLRKVEILRVDRVEDVKEMIGVVTSPKDGIKIAVRGRKWL